MYMYMYMYMCICDCVCVWYVYCFIYSIYVLFSHLVILTVHQGIEKLSGSQYLGFIARKLEAGETFNQLLCGNRSNSSISSTDLESSAPGEQATPNNSHRLLSTSLDSDGYMTFTACLLSITGKEISFYLIAEWFHVMMAFTIPAEQVT